MSLEQTMNSEVFSSIRSFAPSAQIEHYVIIEAQEKSRVYNEERIISEIRQICTKKLPRFEVVIVDIEDEPKKVHQFNTSRRTLVILVRDAPKRAMRYTPTLEAVGETFDNLPMGYRDLNPEMSEAIGNRKINSRDYVSNETLFTNFFLPALISRFTMKNITVHPSRLEEAKESYKEFKQKEMPASATPSPNPIKETLFRAEEVPKHIIESDDFFKRTDMPLGNREEEKEIRVVHQKRFVEPEQRKNIQYETHECKLISYKKGVFDLTTNDKTLWMIDSKLEDFFLKYNTREKIREEYKLLASELSTISILDKKSEDKVEYARNNLNKAKKYRATRAEIAELQARLEEVTKQREYFKPKNIAARNRIRPICSALNQLLDAFPDWDYLKNNIYDAFSLASDVTDFRLIVSVTIEQNPNFAISAFLPTESLKQLLDPANRETAKIQSKNDSLVLELSRSNSVTSVYSEESFPSLSVTPTPRSNTSTPNHWSTRNYREIITPSPTKIEEPVQSDFIKVPVRRPHFSREIGTSD